MPRLNHHPIQKQIISLVLFLFAIAGILTLIHTSLDNKSKRLEMILDNQKARQNIGTSIYQRLFAARAYTLKLYTLENQRELQIIKGRFDTNLETVKRGISVLQNGGAFRDEIALNIPGKNRMDLTADYTKPPLEHYTLEVLELGPAIHDLEQQAALLYELVHSRLTQPTETVFNTTIRIDNLLKVIEANLQRSQEHAAGVLYDSQEKINTLTTQLRQSEQLHGNFRFPVIILALTLAAYSLFITLVRVKKTIEQRNLAEGQLQLLLDNTVEGIYGIDKEGMTTFINPAASRMLGFAPDELIGKGSHALIHHTRHNGTPYPTGECKMLSVIKTGRMITVEDEILWRKDRSSFPVEYSSTPIKINGDIIGTVVNFRDISERVEAEKQIRLLSQAVEQSPVSVIITDLKAQIEYVNSAFELSTGYRASEVIGKNPRILKSGKTPSDHFYALWQALTSGHAWKGELQNRKKNGEVFWERAYIAPVQDESGQATHYLAVKEDISLQKEQEERILHQANYDSLTDLPNRFLALDRLSQIIKESHRTQSKSAVLFIDLDDFKKINDSISHEIGDKLLIEAARRLESTVRDGDTVSRLGGDEFIVLMGHVRSEDDVHPIAEKLLECVRQPFRLDGRELTLTASIGIAVYPNDGETPADLLRNADTAMYQSKAQGRNTYNYFTGAMNRGISRRLQLEEQLHGALERNEFQLVYQPLVDIQNRRIVAAEALLRWTNPSLGGVSPDEFIQVMEQTGQIVTIGRFVFNEALRMTAHWQAIINGEFKIAINISPVQFRDPNLLREIINSIELHGVSPGSIELEITEGVLLSGHAYINDTLNKLSAMGIGIVMDDFGTGYSSLSYLRSYPFDTIKIDRSFIHDITHDPADSELVNAAIAMAHGLGLRVVAEGVETEQQLKQLATQNCEYAQGYLFSQPLPADEFSELLKDHHHLSR